MTYYAERKTINGTTAPVTNSRFGDRRAMERQYHLYCANACDGEEYPNDIDAIEWGTVEQGVLERKVYNKPQPEPEPELEPESEQEPEET